MMEDATPASEKELAIQLGFMSTTELEAARNEIVAAVAASYPPGSEPLQAAWDKYIRLSQAIVDRKRDDGKVHLAAQVGAMLAKAAILRQLAQYDPAYRAHLQEDLSDAWEYSRNAALAWTITDAIRLLINELG